MDESLSLKSFKSTPRQNLQDLHVPLSGNQPRHLREGPQGEEAIDDSLRMLRWCTHSMNPKLAHHCAYQCLLRAAKQSIKIENVNKLREKTADSVYEAYIEDKCIHGVQARHVIASSEQTLRAYLADIKIPTMGIVLRGCCGSGHLGAAHHD